MGRQAPVALLRLMAWLSPAFPVGAFAYSAGLEQAASDGLVCHQADLEAWIAASIDHGALRSDAIFLAEAHRSAGEAARLDELSLLALSLAGSKERHAELRNLGGAFLTAARAWGDQALDASAQETPYPVAIGAVAGRHGVSAEWAILAFLQAYVSHIGSVAIRLGLIGQSAALVLQAGFERRIADAAARLACSSLDDLGTATVIAEIASLRHETHEPRLFRS
nr:urease accessory UreF family protein [Rhizobium halophytocola]